MALIQCPECGSEVSSVARACPKCGYPISERSVAPIPETQVAHTNNSTDLSVEDQTPFPELPTVMNVGKEIFFSPAIPKAHYVQEINHTRYLSEGEVFISAHSNGICISGGLQFFHLAHEQIIDMKFVRHSQLTTENKSVIGRAVVGGLLLGPLAAVVGGMSGIGTKVKSLGEYLMIINFWDTYTHRVQTLLICTPYEAYNFVERVEKEKAKKNIPEGNNYVCNLHDSNGRLSESKILEAVKQIGQEKVAATIAQIEGCGPASATRKIQEIGAKNNVDTTQYKSAGCMVTLLVMLTSFSSILGVIIWLV